MFCCVPGAWNLVRWEYIRKTDYRLSQWLPLPLTLLSLLFCEAVHAQSAGISFGQTRKFPTRYAPPQD